MFFTKETRSHEEQHNRNALYVRTKTVVPKYYYSRFGFLPAFVSPW
jgi:hypothetical protein